jgi:hypothetical protein
LIYAKAIAVTLKKYGRKNWRFARLGIEVKVRTLPTSDLIAKPEKDSAIKYKVVIKRDGTIYDGVSLEEANGVFQGCMLESKQSDDLVTLFQDSEIVRQWYCHFELY